VCSLNRFALIGNIASVRPFDKVVKIATATDREQNDAEGRASKATDFVQVSILGKKRRGYRRYCHGHTSA
jgi:single-stranded DNA-binding protein